MAPATPASTIWNELCDIRPLFNFRELQFSYLENKRMPTYPSRQYLLSAPLGLALCLWL